MPLGIRRLTNQPPIIIRRAIAPPDWTAFTEGSLCSIDLSPNFGQSLWIVPNAADCPARCHQLLNETLALLRLKIRIAQTPQSTANHEIATVWRVRVLLGSLPRHGASIWSPS